MQKLVNPPYRYYSYPDFNLNIISFADVFASASIKLLNNPLIYSKNNYNRFDSDCKRFFLHYLILDACNYISEPGSRNTILFISKDFTQKSYEIFEYFDRVEVSNFVIQQFQKLKSLLPFVVYISEDFVDFSKSSNGEVIDHLMLINNTIVKRLPNPKTSRKLYQFAEKNGLNSIANNFLLSNSFKKLMCEVA